MKTDAEKRKKLKNVRRRKYKIYGIFDFKSKKLVYISLGLDDVEFELDMGNYNDDYGIVSSKVCLF